MDRSELGATLRELIHLSRQSIEFVRRSTQDSVAVSSQRQAIWHAFRSYSERVTRMNAFFASVTLTDEQRAVHHRCMTMPLRKVTALVMGNDRTAEGQQIEVELGDERNARLHEDHLLEVATLHRQMEQVETAVGEIARRVEQQGL